MDKLPIELIDHFCLFLDKTSLQNFRLTCKAIAGIAEKQLFNNFEFRLYPKPGRLHQFGQLAYKTTIASRLECLSFESGIPLEYADYKYWQADISTEGLRAWTRNWAITGDKRAGYHLFHEGLQSRFAPDFPSRYQALRWHLDQQAALVAEPSVRDDLARTLNLLKQSCPSLTFKLIMDEPQIKLEDLENFRPEECASQGPSNPDPRLRIANRRRHCLEHFMNFLDAANLSDFGLDELVAIDMPHELLTVSARKEVLSRVFSHVKRLDLKISAFPHSDWLSRTGINDIYVNGRNTAALKLKTLLGETSELDSLRLEFPIGNAAEYSIELFDGTNLDPCPRLWLSGLRVLSLSCFECKWNDLEKFLADGRNLESLTMKDGRLENGSMLDLLDYLSWRRFPKVELWGVWHVQQDMGHWHSHSEEDFNICSKATSFEGPYASYGLRSEVQEYIHGGSKCPFPRWTADHSPVSEWENLSDTSWHFVAGI
ncbi:uncharacterized protein PV06_01689 [Exophiala oligosperma]|uniref:F-box domain-containing protein n=2 Tax=Chaetothyriales TaxID=34395 RepID=A0A0D2EDK8_9EURO|nr:uncharacterized protein PV06_01689 [Exophiala oligosperma]KAJ9612657.1 hypothetical protein H2204_015031 [Knufia peltigerae]KIW45994.1 hypothetical protein PV06_01689 [Exophiala oligosperma]